MNKILGWLSNASWRVRGYLTGLSGWEQDDQEQQDEVAE